MYVVSRFYIFELGKEAYAWHIKHGLKGPLILSATVVYI